MSRTGSTSTSSPLKFDIIFNSALETYKRRTKQDLTSNPLLPRLQACDSPDAVLAVLREQIPEIGQSHSVDDKVARWLVPTVNVLYGFSAAIGEGVGLVFSPARVIFAGVGVLLLAAKDTGASQDTLLELFSRIESFFKRLEIYIEVPPTTGMMEIIIKIMAEVLSILGIATKEMKRGLVRRYVKKLMGGTDMDDSLRRLDSLTQEESRMAAAELRKAMDRVDGRVMRVDEGLQGVRRGVEGMGMQVQVIEDKVQDVDERVQDVDERMQEVHDAVQGVGDGVNDVRDVVEGIGGGMKDVQHAIQNVDDAVQGVETGVRAIGHQVQGASDQVRGVDDKVDQINRNQLRDSLRTWLSPSNPSMNHNIAREAHHEGSAEWFFRGSLYKQWKSAGSFLWIHGKPGSGKSILCSGIIEDIMTLRDSGKASVGYFYFDFRDTDKQHRHDVLPSLLIQLSARSGHCCDILARLYSAHDCGIHKPSDRAMMDCLKEMLTLPGQRPTYIIMDALDECPRTSGIPSPREEVLVLVKELVGLRLPNLHVCVTSRPEVDIKGVLQPLCPHPVSLQDETGQMQDIIDYVSHVVQSDDAMWRWREEDKDLVIKTLSEKADGMFRWVFCQLELLRQCFPPSVRRILEELPESLDGTYERVLKEIRKPNQLHAYRLMQCLVVAARPLRVEELAEVLAIDFDSEVTARLNPNWRWPDQERAVMSACSSLVSVVKVGVSRMVQFSHFSVKEFLMSHRLAESSQNISRYHIKLEAAHTILAQACLGVLIQLDNSVDRDNIRSFPLARYAAGYWFKHAQFKNVSSRVKDGMVCLFDSNRPHFAIYFWIRHSSRDMRPSQPDEVPLYHAADLGIRDLVERLLTMHPEDINAKGGREVTPLHVAAAEGCFDVVSLLIDHFPDLNVQGKWRQTPLHRASWRGHLEVVRLLLSRGADVNARDNTGWTPLYIAAMDGRLEIARMLLERNASINTPASDGETPLHTASGREHVEVVRLLLEHGADPNLRTRSGRTPRDVASGQKKQEIRQLLTKYGAEAATA